MALVVEGRHIQVRAHGESCFVPNNPYARLMYYLQCVGYVFDLDFGYLANFDRYASIDSSDKSKIVQFAVFFDPISLSKFGVFTFVSEKDKFFDGANKFFDITDEAVNYINVSNVIEIGSYQYKASRLFVGTEQWLKDNFLDPIKTIRSLSYRPAITCQTERRSEPTTTSQTERRSEPTRTSHSCDCHSIQDGMHTFFCCECRCCDWDICRGCCDCCSDCAVACCLFILSFAFPPFGLLMLIIGCCSSEPSMRCAASYGMIIMSLSLLALILGTTL